MRHARFPRFPVVAPALLAALSLGLAACGGDHLKGYSVDVTPLAITSTTISEAPSGADANTLYESADKVDWEIPLQGGCGGPYVLSIIQGALPKGVALVGGTDPNTNASLHHIRGILLEDGTFNFRVQVVDKACEPFLSTFSDFTWTVARGRVSIVDATPILYGPGELIKQGVVQNPVYPALKTVVYNQFTALELIVAGGTPPYYCQIIDDPNNPDDGSLPIGTTIPPASRSIVGAPVEVRAGGAPFIFTVQAVDSTGQTGQLTMQWQVDTPPIIIATTDLPDGKCGQQYSETIVIVDGVPPFKYEFVQCDVNRNGDGEPDVVWQSPADPVITPACATARITAANYPAQNNAATDYRSFFAPPEGIYLGDAAGNPLVALGSVTGKPRRRGDFRVALHVYSSLVPKERGQHNWAQYDFHIDESEPPTAPSPAYDMNPAFTLDGAFTATQPYPRIAEAEVGAAYNPDSASHPAPGLQFLARGGVRKDGLTDAPHASEVTDIDGLGAAQEDGSTPGGGYDWAVNPNPPADGDAYSVLPPGMALDGWLGVWRVATPAALQRQGFQALELTVADQQLPIQEQNIVTRRVNFSVGPDKVIITESPLSNTNTGGSLDQNDHTQTVRVVEPYVATAPLLRNLNSTDLTPTHTVPSTTGGAAINSLLASQDLLRVTVNPAGWWDDVHQINANGARPMQHGDTNRGAPMYAPSWSSAGTTSIWVPSATSVDIPRCTATAVTHDPANGIYKDGGRMYAFANNSYFGVFMVRSDATIYVPTAFNRSTYQAFGDATVETYGAQKHSALRTPQMAVSPCGRFAAMKIKTQETNFYETVSTTKIVIFSLTGEKAFGGQTYKIIDPGTTGSLGSYLYAASLCLTSSHLYYICGNYTYYDAAWRGHYIFRYEIANPTTGAVTASASAGAPLPSATGDTEWTNTTSGNSMQTRFQNWLQPTQSYGGFTYPGFVYTVINTTNDDQYLNDGMNIEENSMAPVPFRVSRDGKAIAILAARDTFGATSTDTMNYHVWVDYQGGNVRRLTTSRLHVTGGGARGYTLGYGPGGYPNWLRYDGPTPQLEISDDATKVAVVANRYTGSISPFSNAWYAGREDVVAFRTANNWTSTTVLPVTGDGGSSNIFGGSTYWRFGALVFTADNKGLVFWAGASQYYASSSSSSYQSSYMYAGSLWGTDISTATGITGLTITSMLTTADGGPSVGQASYTTSSAYSPTLATGSYTNGQVAGVLKPLGGFLSKSREFFYMTTLHPLAASDATTLRLVGVNIRSTNTAQNIQGRTDFRGFAVSSWPTRRGFLPNYYYMASYPLSGNRFYAPGRVHGGGLQVMAKDSGVVYFGSHYQRNGPSSATGSSSFGGPVYNTYWGDYGVYGGQVEAFQAEVGGPVRRLTSLGSDTSYNSVHFIEPTGIGTEIAAVYHVNSSSGRPSSERLRYVGNIQFNANGTANGSVIEQAVEGSDGRVSDSIAFSSGRNKLYYGFNAGGGNENQKTIKEATFSGTTMTIRTVVATPASYNVLFSGR